MLFPEFLTSERPSEELKVYLSDNQYEVFGCPARFRVLVAGRRFGKTELAVAELVHAARKSPNSLVWYIGPTEELAESIMWPRLKKVTMPHWAKTPNESKHRIDLTNGSTLIVKGAFKPDSLRGHGVDFVVLDEVADLKPATWDLVLRPSLADREGRALFIGTPKGRNHLFDYFERTHSNPDWASFHFTTEEGGIVKPGELESAGRDVDLNVFRQEFNAEFTAVGKHRAYLAFDRKVNVTEVSYQNYLPLIWSLDFNVDPMCMLIMQKITDDIRVFEEKIISPDGSTLKACQVIHERFNHYYRQTDSRHLPLQIHIHGDATGNQRRTSSGGKTDLTLIYDYFRNLGSFQIHPMFPSVNPLVRDRVNCVNARLRNKNGESRLFISPSCKELIRDLEEVSWALDSTGAPLRELDKSDPKRTHTSDALGYAVAKLFPLAVPGKC